jgi:hypothetical protein
MTMNTKITLAIALMLFGFLAPRFVGNRDTTSWAIWFVRRLLPALCFGAAIGLVVAAIRKG